MQCTSSLIPLCQLPGVLVRPGPNSTPSIRDVKILAIIINTQRLGAFTVGEGLDDVRNVEVVKNANITRHSVNTCVRI
jgi:hypothetical protein